MKNGLSGPKQLPAFQNKYLTALAVTVAALLIGVCAFAQQPDTSRTRQNINASPGYSYRGIDTRELFRPPQDTSAKLAIKDTGAIVHLNGKLYAWTKEGANEPYWAEISGAGGSDILGDSITWIKAIGFDTLTWLKTSSLLAIKGLLVTTTDAGGINKPSSTNTDSTLHYVIQNGWPGWNANKLYTRNLSSAAPSNLQYLGWNSTLNQWEPKSLPAASMAGGSGGDLQLNDGSGGFGPSPINSDGVGIKNSLPAYYAADYSASMITDRFIPDIGKVNALIAASGGGTGDEGLYKSGSEFLWGVPNASSANPFTEHRRINFANFTMQLRNGGGNNPFFNYNDPQTVTNAGGAKSTVYNIYQPINQSDDGSVFYHSQSAVKPLSESALTNHVMIWGWNLGPGVAQVDGDLPALGESWESRYDANGSGSGFLLEKHEILVLADGTHIRLSSYTADETGGVNYYHQVDQFYLKEPLAPDSIWLSFDVGDYDFHGQVGGNITMQLIDRDNPGAYITAITQADGFTQFSSYDDISFTSVVGSASFAMQVETEDLTVTGFLDVSGTGGSPSTGQRITSTFGYANLAFVTDDGTAQIVYRTTADGGRMQFYKPNGQYDFGNNAGTHFIIGGSGIINIPGLATGGASEFLTVDASGNISSTPSGGGGAGALDDLTDVVISSATTGQALIFNGTNWVNDDLPSGTISGLTTNTIPKATSSTSIGNSRITDDATDIVATTNSFLLKNGANTHYSAVVDASTGVYTMRSKTGSGAFGWQFSLNDAGTVDIGVVGASGPVDATWSGTRNVTFSPSGIVTFNTSVTTAGAAASFGVGDNGTGLGAKVTYLQRDEGVLQLRGERHSSGASTTPWQLNVDAADNSWVMASTGIITTANLQKYASDLSGSYDARSLVDKGYVDGLITTTASGTHTPTLTAVTNVNGTPTATQGQYSRVGNTVTYSVTVTLSATATGLVELGISLPVASDFSADYNAVGNAVSTVVSDVSIVGQVLADATNNRLSLVYSAPDTEARTFTIHVTYKIVAP